MRELYTHIHLEYVKVKFFSCIKKEEVNLGYYLTNYFFIQYLNYLLFLANLFCYFLTS